MTIDTAMEQPAHMVLSGPASGVVGAAAFAEMVDERNLITIDMCGTGWYASVPADVGLTPPDSDGARCFRCEVDKVAAAGILSPFWLVGALAWLGHIVVDLGFGDGLRTADGWRRPWWTSR